MSQLIRPDFIDYWRIIPPEIRKIVSSVPHRLIDPFENVISEFQPEQLNANEVPIKVDTLELAFLRAPDEQRPLLANLFEICFRQGIEAQLMKQRMEDQELLSKDLEELLRISENDELPFEEKTKHLIKILRCHLWVERSSIFGIYDGFTLEGFAGLGGKNNSNWKLSFGSVAGYAATTRKLYHTEDPKNDPNYEPKTGVEIPRNLVCCPLIHGDTLVGVMNCSNRIGGKFSERDFEIIQRFSRIAAHILQKHYFREKVKELERTSGHLGKYLSSKVVKNVSTNVNQTELGGIEKKVVCLFSDIRGFTSLSENISAAQLVKLLNFHFDRMTTVIEKYEGTVDKIVGDLIMAVWNIPNDQPEPELLAMKAAIDMQKEMIRSVLPEWSRYGVPRVGMGIGVNSGTALVGNLGSARFMNYTVIGDTVNTAQRLESRARSGEIWMAESLFESVQGKIEKPSRKEINIQLDGKEEMIHAYIYKPLSY